jgi:hypothetical protein
LCVLHTPGAASRAGKIGGRPRTVFDVSRLKKFPPAETTTDVRRLMAHRLNEVTDGILDPELGTKLFYMQSCLLRAAEQEAIEQVKAELEELKRRLGARSAAQRGGR